MADACAGIQGLSHVRINQVRVSASFSRSRSRSGLLAYIVPLKYRWGSPVETRVHKGRVYHYAMLPRYHDGSESLYVIYFLLPRFFGLTARQKLETIIHELYHISPRFDGDLRRFGVGRKSIHGNTKAYDLRVREMADELMAFRSPMETYGFLTGNYRELRSRYERIETHRIPEPRPRLLRVENESQCDAFSSPAP